MATKNTKLTVSQSFDILSIVLATVDPATLEKAVADVNPNATVEEFNGKFDHMNANAHKTSKPSKRIPSKASIANQNDAEKFSATWNHNDVFTLASIGEVLPLRQTSQSRVSVVNVLMRANLIEHVEKVNGRTAYKFVA